jgi:PAS domain S-box-containing protein
MQTFYKRFSVILGFAVLLLILVVNAFVTRRELGIQTGMESWVYHTQQVLSELGRIELLVRNAESAQRGFLYTGDRRHLAPYNDSVGFVLPQIDAVAQLTADNPTEQARIPELRRITQAKMDELAQTISLYNAGKPGEAKAVVLSDRGLQLMNELHALVAEMEADETALSAARTANYERSIRRTVMSIYLASLLAAAGLSFLAYYIMREIGTRERHAAEMRTSEEWFRVTLSSIGDAVIATDNRGNVNFFNQLAEKLTGVELAKARGRNILDVFPIFNEQTREPAENPVTKVMRLGTVVGLANHTVLKHTNGSFTPIDDSAAPIRDDQGRLIGVVLVFRDVSFERKSQELMRKTEKLAAAARLSATVAHEINNPLEAIVNLVYIAKINPDTPTAVVQQLTLAEQELERVAHIARQTLGFYRDRGVPEDIEIPPLIDTVLKLYSHKLHAKAIRAEHISGECPAIRGVPGELKQAISNLISNAADAAGWEGRITVRSESVQVDRSAFVQVVVEDDGPGIPPELMDRIFEPFFTTKKDVGTGLGLWVTKGIVDRHGGSIAVRSRRNEPGRRGTAFTVRLPLNSSFESPGLDAN